MRILAFSLAVFVGIATNSLPARADDGPTGAYRGGGGTPAYNSPEGLAASAFKSAFFAGYYEHRKAGGTLADFKDLAPLSRRLGIEVVAPMAYPAPYYSNVLYPYPQYEAQINDWYCGPASAWVAMKHRGIGNNHFGAPLTQQNLGTWYWLETDTYKQTPRGENWRRTLNGWVDGTNDGWYAVHTYGGYAPAADVASKFASDIDLSFAPVMNVLMNSSRGWLQGWKGLGYQFSEHYVPGFGYNQYGDFLHYVEVFGRATPGYKWSETKETFATLVGGYGMIW